MADLEDQLYGEEDAPQEREPMEAEQETYRAEEYHEGELEREETREIVLEEDLESNHNGEHVEQVICREPSIDEEDKPSPKNTSSSNGEREGSDVGNFSSKERRFCEKQEITEVQTLRPRIEENEMPTRGKVSSLKSLFENKAVESSEPSKHSNYKQEYGVGKSYGVVNKGVFH